MYSSCVRNVPRKASSRSIKRVSRLKWDPPSKGKDSGGRRREGEETAVGVGGGKNRREPVQQRINKTTSPRDG